MKNSGLIGLTVAVWVASGLGAVHMAAAKSSADSREAHQQGEWRIGPKRSDGSVQVEFKRTWQSGSGRGTWISSSDIEREKLKGISPAQWSAAEAKISFALECDAGTFRGEGRIRRGQGSGSFVFEPEADYVAQLERGGFHDPSLDDLARLCMNEVSREWLSGFGARGHQRYSLDELLRFKANGVSAGYVTGMKEAGASDTGADELIRLKVNGVEPSYVRELTSTTRRRYSTDEIVRLKVNGVTTAMIRDAESRRPGLTVDEMIRLKHTGRL